jgi:hypothetical protein
LSGGGVWFSETDIITVLKSVAGKCLVKTKDFYVSCDYSDNCSVLFNGTVIVGCGGDPEVVNTFPYPIRNLVERHSNT